MKSIAMQCSITITVLCLPERAGVALLIAEVLRGLGAVAVRELRGGVPLEVVARHDGPPAVEGLLVVAWEGEGRDGGVWMSAYIGVAGLKPGGVGVVG